MNDLGKKRQFLKFAIGYICFGFGQYLIGNGVIHPIVKGRYSFQLLGGLGAILLSIGLFIIIQPIIRLFKYYNQNNRVLKLLGIALGVSVLSGLIIGSIGQIISHYDILNYHAIKYGIWVATSILQSLLKMIIIYQVGCILTDNSFKSSNSILKQLVIGAVVVSVITIMISTIVPTVSDILFTITDSVIILGTIYVSIYKLS